MTEPALRTHGLSVRYGEVTAVDRLSMQGHFGEIVGLLGPNGAGKTSVIRALTTIVRPSGGHATICGHPLSDERAVRSVIGVLPESNGYPAAQTGRSYLRFYGQLHGLGRVESDRRARRMLERMGLGANANAIATYSRGMRQRLGLARALVNDPRVLFLDEPTLGLDPAGKEDVLRLLVDTAAAGACVVLCSHLLDEVERICDRVEIMDRGRIVASGSVADVVDRLGAGRSDARLSDAFLSLTGGSR